MKEFKGKPGTWHWEGKVLCNDAHIVGGDRWTFSDADKRLIDAAPELLEALRFTIHDLGHWLSTQKPELKEKIESAINKALGE